MIKRYDIDNCKLCIGLSVSKAEDGDLVYYEDHAREVAELGRRVRWLESLFSNETDKQLHDAHRSFEIYNENCAAHECGLCGGDDLHGHKDSCPVFLKDGTPKPTPEDFK